MTRVEEYVQVPEGELADYEFLQQFEPDAEGIRLNDQIPFDRMREVYDLDQVWGDIAGERQMRAYATTDILDGTVTREHFIRGFTREEFNDLINYHAWNTYSWLALRATEGESEIIPRQEYEFLSTCWAFLRYPEFDKVLIDTLGIDGLIDVGVASRRELGTSIGPAGGWVGMVVPGFGAIGLRELGYFTANDPAIVDKKRTAYTVGLALSYGARGEDGYLRSSQAGFVNDAKDPAVIDFVTDHLVPLEGQRKATFRSFNAAVELLSFLMHYDNRVGLLDHGPYLVDDGKPLLLREVFLDQSYLPWRHIAADRGLPRCVTLAMVIDPSEVGLQEIRSEVGTVTVPPEYLDGIEAGAVFLRDAEEQVTPLPLTELDVMEIDDLPGMTAKANEAVTEWYEHVAQLSRRDKIMNGAKVYYIGMVAPLLKATGTYEYFCDELDLWELHPIVSEAYYDCMGEMAQEFVPTQIIFGYGWSEIPDTPDTESPYGELLADIQDTGWNSDLTGMQPVPEYWEDRMNDDGLLDVPLTKTDGEVAREDLGDFLSSL